MLQAMFILRDPIYQTRHGRHGHINAVVLHKMKEIHKLLRSV